MECSICGVSGQISRIFDAISSREGGIVKVCENCSKKENMPILRRPTTFQLKKAETTRVYDGLLLARKKEGVREIRPKKFYEKDKQDITLREIVDRNYKQLTPKRKEPRLDLVDNFHWVIMRARRLKKITQESLAKEISESEAAIKMVEQGILPEDEKRIIRKLESFLGIKLLKNDLSEEKFFYDESFENFGKNKKQPARIIKFDPLITRTLTISDLKKMKDEEANSLLDEEDSENFKEFDDSLEEDEYEET